MKVYFDTSALVPFLFGEVLEAKRFQKMTRLFNTLNDGRIVGLLSFYAINELYQYLANNYSSEDTSEGFREGLLQLLAYPIVIVPFLDRINSNRLRRSFTIADSYDALHVACALSHQCDAIVTYDSHFQTVTPVIEVMTPEDVLAQLSDSDKMEVNS